MFPDRAEVDISRGPGGPRGHRSGGERDPSFGETRVLPSEQAPRHLPTDSGPIRELSDVNLSRIDLVESRMGAFAVRQRFAWR